MALHKRSNKRERVFYISGKISRDELIKELKQAESDSHFDPEVAHECADLALLAYIDDAEVMKAFLRVKRWYA